MSQTLIELLFLINRFVHILCTAVIIGGTLFYEMIVPVAIGELKEEQQLYVFGRARWTFKGVVWTCAILLLLSGLVSSARMWHTYTGWPATQLGATGAADAAATAPHDERIYAQLRRPGLWWAAHASLGVVALAIAVVLATVRRPPTYPLAWMRVTLTVLLVVIFLADTARHMRLATAAMAPSPAPGNWSIPIPYEAPDNSGNPAGE
jgi:hypothetical protein